MKSYMLLERLINHIMSERQAKVYLALLQMGSATSAELQKASGIPQTKIYEIVRQLVGKGYCRERKAGHKRTFEAIDPAVALMSNVHQLEGELETINQLKADLSKYYSQVVKQAEPLEYIDVLKGNDTIHQHYCGLVKSANEEILGFGRGPYSWKVTDKLKEQERYLADMVQRGGVSRWVFELKLPDESVILDYIENLKGRGVTYRVSNSLPVKMMIFDRHTLLIADEDPYAPRGDLTMSIIKQPTIVKAFTALFEYFWNNSIDFDAWRKKYTRALKTGAPIEIT